MSEVSNNPFDIMRACLEEKIYILLKEGKEMEGVLQAFDTHTNIFLENVTEKNKVTSKIRFFDLLFVRGDSIVLVSPLKDCF